MKLLQYNIFFGSTAIIDEQNRMNNVCKLLLESESDIICLQEVLKSQYMYLVENISVKYPYYYPSSDKLFMGSYDTMIFSKFPMKESFKQRFEGTNMGRNMNVISIDYNLQTIYICTTHFESEFGKDCTNKKYQYVKCADLLYQLHKRTNCPIFLCTDTNACDNSESILLDAFNYSKGWRDAWIEFGSDPNTKYTFDSTTNPILLDRYKSDNRIYKSQLDRIMHISDMHVSDFKLIGTNKIHIASDHYGVLTEFTKEKPPHRGTYIPQMIMTNKNSKKRSSFFTKLK